MGVLVFFEIKMGVLVFLPMTGNKNGCPFFFYPFFSFSFFFHSARMSIHGWPELVFTMGQNMHPLKRHHHSRISLMLHVYCHGRFFSRHKSKLPRTNQRILLRTRLKKSRVQAYGRGAHPTVRRPPRRRRCI